MTKPAHTTPPPDAAARRRALPVLTYSVEQLPSFDAAFYNGARAELSKVTELTVPPRDAKAFELDGQPFHLRLDQLLQRLPITITVGTGVEIARSLPDDRNRDCHHGKPWPTSSVYEYAPYLPPIPWLSV